MPAIYTRSGDKGTTGLFGGSRVAKQSLRVEAYGSIDEANSAIGQAKAWLDDGDWRDRVHQLQLRLFVAAAELASDENGEAQLVSKIDQQDINDLEKLIDDCLAITGPQRAFVVPGRDRRSAAFHVARTVVRRAERRVLALADAEPVRPELIKFLNRASDAVYALARLCERWADSDKVHDLVLRAIEKYTGTSHPDPASTEPTDSSAHGSQKLDLTTAKALAEASERKAAEMGVPIVIGIVDAGGGTLLIHRMPDALLASSDLAIDKAWTAAAFRRTTESLGSDASEGAMMPGLASACRGRVVLFGGGAPIMSGSHVLGGVGISGGTVGEDIEILNHAITTVMGDMK